jgi:hypothetical protein
VYGAGSLAETALAESPGGAAPIIPEVANEVRGLVFVVEIEFITVGDVPTSSAPSQASVVQYLAELVEYDGEGVEL